MAIILSISVPRAVLDERARRGVAGVPQHVAQSDVDLYAFWAHQVTARANAD